MTTVLPPGTYPRELVGPAARPPTPVRPSVLQLARDARRRQLAAELAEPPRYGFTMPDWRLAHCLTQCRNELNAAHPGRDTSSDGTIGNPAHAGRGPGFPEWDDSDHNPWLVVAGMGVVRALDVDADGPDLAAAFERIRAKVAAGQLPQLEDGGYAILNGRITAEDWTGWRQYKGTNPHVLHGHLSTSTDPARFDLRTPWGVWTAAAPPRPMPPVGPGWTGPDLRGSALTLRGEYGANGRRVESLQEFLRRYAPLYAAGLVKDGWWGSQTTGVLRQFALRTGIRSADGRNIGPQLARKLYLAGFRG